MRLLYPRKPPLAQRGFLTQAGQEPLCDVCCWDLDCNGCY